MYLVFDVGGTFIKYALMDEEGTIIEKSKLPTPTKPGQNVPEFVETIGGIYDSYQNQHDILGIAMGLPGQIDVERGIVYGGGGIKYLDGVALGSLISKRCNGLKVAMENDGKCAALAEVWKGNASDSKDACVLVFGTGIGGGIVIDRKIHRGNRLVAGEVSYMMADMTRDQAEGIVTAETVDDLVESMENMPFVNSVQMATFGIVIKAAKLKSLPIDEVDGVKIYEWYMEGDSEIAELLEDWYFHIAKLCCNIYVLFDPDVILIGGGISAQPLFLEGIKRYVEKLKKVSNVFKGLRVDACRFLNDSNLLGALYNYKQLYEGLI